MLLPVLALGVVAPAAAEPQVAGSGSSLSMWLLRRMMGVMATKVLGFAGSFSATKTRRGQNKKGKALDFATKQRYLEEYRRRKSQQVPHPERSMLLERGNFPDLYSGCFAKWAKTSARQRRDKVCANMPGAAKKARQMPRWLLASVECPDKGSGRNAGKLPDRVLKIAEEVLLQQLRLGAENRRASRCEPPGHVH